eukprot:TRINITY_DN5373_c0_g1_i1.p1 TRINITY_DN5373_c0_g1~~TRINITY_DN5373_c0_g1_i1.p1  ORF type:complete len:203 (+),score=50.68 TRINITY_DN5373_c0_g1_i1:91-609(+)
MECPVKLKTSRVDRENAMRRDENGHFVGEVQQQDWQMTNNCDATYEMQYFDSHSPINTNQQLVHLQRQFLLPQQQQQPHAQRQQYQQREALFEIFVKLASGINICLPNVSNSSCLREIKYMLAESGYFDVSTDDCKYALLHKGKMIGRSSDFMTVQSMGIKPRDTLLQIINM